MKGFGLFLDFAKGVVRSRTAITIGLAAFSVLGIAVHSEAQSSINSLQVLSIQHTSFGVNTQLGYENYADTGVGVGSVTIVSARPGWNQNSNPNLQGYVLPATLIIHFTAKHLRTPALYQKLMNCLVYANDSLLKNTISFGFNYSTGNYPIYDFSLSDAGFSCQGAPGLSVRKIRK